MADADGHPGPNRYADRYQHSSIYRDTHVRRHTDWYPDTNTHIQHRTDGYRDTNNNADIQRHTN